MFNKLHSYRNMLESLLCVSSHQSIVLVSAEQIVLPTEKTSRNLLETWSKAEGRGRGRGRGEREGRGRGEGEGEGEGKERGEGGERKREREREMGKRGEREGRGRGRGRGEREGRGRRRGVGGSREEDRQSFDLPNWFLVTQCIACYQGFSQGAIKRGLTTCHTFTSKRLRYASITHICTFI